MKPQEFENHIRICNEAKRRAESAFKKGKANDCISEAANLLTLIESLLKERESEKWKLKCDAYHLLSLAYKQIKNSSSAFRYLTKELEIATKFNFILQQVKAYHQLGIMYHLAGDTIKTTACFNKVLEAMGPNTVDELISENASAEEKRQVHEVHEWVKSIISEIKMVPKESVFTPIATPLHKYSEDMKSDVITKSFKMEQPETQDESIIAEIPEELPTSYRVEDTEHLVQSFKEKEKTEEIFTEFRESKRKSEISDDELVIGEILEEPAENIAIEHPIKLVQFIKVKEKIKEFIPATTVDIKDETSGLLEEKEMRELNGKVELKISDDESIAKKILEETIKNIEMEYPVKLVQSFKEKEKTEEFIPATIVDIKGKSGRLLEEKEIHELYREIELKVSDEESIIEKILEETIKNTETEHPIKVVHSFEEKEKIAEFIPGLTVDGKDKPSSLDSVTDIDKSSKVKEPKSPYDRSTVIEILEKVIENIAMNHSLQLVQSIEEKVKSGEFIPATTVDTKDEPDNFKEGKETHESSRDKESEVSDEESIVEEILEELTENNGVEQPIQLAQSAEKKIKTIELIPKTIVDSKNEADKFADVKEKHKSSRIEESEVSANEKIIGGILEVLTKKIATEHPLELAQFSEEKEKNKECIPVKIVNRTDKSSDRKETKEIHDSSTVRESESSDGESIIEEILEELTENIASEDTEPKRGSSLKYNSLKFIESADELNKLEKEENSPECTKITEKCDDSITGGFTEVRSKSDKSKETGQLCESMRKKESEYLTTSDLIRYTEDPNELKKIEELHELRKEDKKEKIINDFNDQSSDDEISEKLVDSTVEDGEVMEASKDETILDDHKTTFSAKNDDDDVGPSN